MRSCRKYRSKFALKHKGKLFVLFFFVTSISYHAQCAMCRASLANEENKAKAEAVNDGIVYLMVIPYILVGAIFYWIYRMKKSKKI